MALAYQNLTAAPVHPLGLVDYARFSLQLRLYESDSDALKQNFVGIGAVPRSARPGGASASWPRCSP